MLMNTLTVRSSFTPIGLFGLTPQMNYRHVHMISTVCDITNAKTPSKLFLTLQIPFPV